MDQARAKPEPGPSLHRLCVNHPLAPGETIPLDAGQANYLLNVLRLQGGAPLLVFNGRDGEFLASLTATSRRAAGLTIAARQRVQPAPSGLVYAFAPLKHARLDYMVQKAVEMGAGTLAPIVTRRTQVSRVNIERMRANAIEAAEQCGILCLPEIREACPLEAFLAAWPATAPLVFCDEDATVNDPVAALRHMNPPPTGAVAVLVGPEGGFDPSERETLSRLPNVVRLSLGFRVLRADTAAVAALAIVQAVIGDWRTS